MAEPPRRFPPPWHTDPMPGGYVVRDANGQALVYLYSRDSDVALPAPIAECCPIRTPGKMQTREPTHTWSSITTGSDGGSMRCC
jgi:hypothetical protein